MRPTTAIVSKRESALRFWRYVAVFVFILSGTVLGQDRSPLPVTFEVSPSYARVYIIDGSINEYEANKKVYIDPSKAVRAGGQKLRVKFLVPKWGTDLEQVRKDPSAVDWDEEAFVDFSDLKREQRFPSSGVLKIELGWSSAFQAFTRARPILSLAIALFGLGLVVSLPRLKSLVHKLTATEPAQLIPGYLMVGPIGSGGMGEVWEARSETELHCAIKLIRPELNEDPEFRKRFKREVESCLPLSHPNLLKIYGYGDSTDGRMYMISEYLDGETLKDLIRRGPEDRPQLAVLVLEQIGDALAYLHNNGLVHRDVKPDNIFVCKDGTLKLMDMGLIHGEDMTVLTQTGQVLGTPAYMPPEQMVREATAASDQYSLGIILYEILAGQRPFLQPTLAMLAYQHRHVAPAPPSEHEARIPEVAETGILKMLEKEPEARFASIEEVQESFASALIGLSWVDTEETAQAQLKDFDPTS